MYNMENLRARRASDPNSLQQVGAMTGDVEAMEQLLN